MKCLTDDKARQAIQNEEAYWQRLGISSVPTVVFNRRSAMNGAQPVEAYKQALQELLV